MFQETFKRANAIAQRMRELLTSLAAVREDKLHLHKEEINEVFSLMHDIAQDPELSILISGVAAFKPAIRGFYQLIASLKQSGHGDLVTCPVCEIESATGSSTPHGAIDRPLPPHIPTKIEGGVLLSYLLKLRPWLVEARDELFDNEDPYQQMPTLADRYVISDVEHAVAIGNELLSLSKCGDRWGHLIEQEGPEWTGMRVGMMRMTVLEEMTGAYYRICKPEIAGKDAGHLSSLFEKLHSLFDGENPLDRGHGGWL